MRLTVVTLCRVLTQVKWALFTLASWGLVRGAFDLQGQWHALPHWKEARIAILLTLFGKAWSPGPNVSWLGHRYRADFALPDRKIALEVCSVDEIRKITVARAMAFRASGWQVHLVQGPWETLRLLRSLR